MRNPFASLSKLPKVAEAGRLLRGRLESALDEFPGFVHDVGGRPPRKYYVPAA